MKSRDCLSLALLTACLFCIYGCGKAPPKASSPEVSRMVLEACDEPLRTAVLLVVVGARAEQGDLDLNIVQQGGELWARRDSDQVAVQYSLWKDEQENTHLLSPISKLLTQQ